MVEIFQRLPIELSPVIWIVILGENRSKSIPHHRPNHFASNRVEHFKGWRQTRKLLRDTILKYTDI